MKSTKFKRQIVKIICLLFIVGILCISAETTVFAAEVVDLPEVTTETPEIPEVPDPDGQASLQITLDEDNGSINGALRILIILTLISFSSCADTLHHLHG